jgi:hypothetical protein
MVFCLGTTKEESRNCSSLDSQDFASSTLFIQTSNWDEVWRKLVAFLESFPTMCCTSLAHTRVESILNFLMVGSQIANLTPSLSFCRNLCCRCPNGSWEAIFDIYTSITFQWHEKRLKARCFDPYNWTMKFRKSRRTPKSPFWECECHPHTLPKVGLRQQSYDPYTNLQIINMHMFP